MMDNQRSVQVSRTVCKNLYGPVALNQSYIFCLLFTINSTQFHSNYYQFPFIRFTNLLFSMLLKGELTYYTAPRVSPFACRSAQCDNLTAPLHSIEWYQVLDGNRDRGGTTNYQFWEIGSNHPYSLKARFCSLEQSSLLVRVGIFIWPEITSRNSK